VDKAGYPQTMWRVDGRARIVTVAMSLLIVIAGCGPTTDPGTTGQNPTTAEAVIAELGSAAQPTKVTFERPAGFADSQDYHVVVPLYPNGVSQWIVPDGGQGGLDVIGITSYLLDRDVSGASDRELRELVRDYADKVDAVSTSEPEKSTVAGYPALTQSVKQPGRDNAFTYEATYVFAGPYLVHVMCQYDRQRAAIAEACASVLKTLRLAIT